MDIDLRALTIITGPNMCGKTAILESVMLDMIGHVPRLGKLHKNTLEMASGQVMQVMTEHENPKYSRNQIWNQTKKYSNVTEPADQPFAPVELISLQDFFGLSAADQTRFLLRRCGHNATIDQVWAKLMTEMASLGFVESDMQSIVHLKNTDKLCADWMEELTAAVKTLLRDTKSELAGAQAATSEVTSQTSGGSLADTIQNHQAEIDAVTKERADIQKQARTAAEASGKAQGALDAIVKHGGRCKAELAKIVVDAPVQIARIEEDAKKLPVCNKCGGPVECAACKSKATMNTVALINKKSEIEAAKKAKESEIEKSRIDWAAQKKVVDAALEEKLRTEALDAPFVDQLAELGQKQARWHAEQGKKAAAEKAKSKVEGLDLKRNLLTQFAKVTNDTVNGILESAIKETMAVANLVITPTLGITVDYKDGGFGYDTPNSRAGLSTFSGTQEAMLFLGVSLALTMKAPEKIFLVDEFSTFRPDTKEKFLEVVYNLIQEGLIHQIIIADPNLPLDVPPDTMVVTLSGKQ